MNDIHQDLLDGKERLGALAKSSPEVFKGFSAMSKAAMADGALSTAHKELAAVAISCVQRCDDCVLYHVDAARRAGAEEKQLLEMLQVAIEMGGGPALMYAGRALNAWRAMDEEKQDG